jgi:hypothetical protein
MKQRVGLKAGLKEGNDAAIPIQGINGIFFWAGKCSWTPAVTT